MKKYFLVILFLSVFFSVVAQNADSTNSKTEKEQFLSQKNEILMLLFDGIEITNQHQKNEVKWKPNFYENKQDITSDDDFAYTQLDTIFFYQEGDTKKAAAVFATYMYEENRVIDAHFYAPNVSVATFKYDEKLKKWESVLFDKFYGIHGLWGELFPISFKKIGNDIFAIIFEAGFVHMGENTQWTTIYDLSSCKKLKTIHIYYDNSGFYEDKEKQIAISKDLEFDATQVNKNGYYDLIITTINKDSTKVEVFEYKNLEGYVLVE